MAIKRSFEKERIIIGDVDVTQKVSAEFFRIDRLEFRKKLCYSIN